MSEETPVERHGAYETRPIHVHRDTDGLIRRTLARNLQEFTEAAWEAATEAGVDPTEEEEHTVQIPVGPYGNGLVQIRDDACWVEAYGHCDQCLYYSNDYTIVKASRYKFDQFGLVITSQFLNDEWAESQ